MNKLFKLRKDHLEARKEGNSLKALLLSTLLGEVDKALKNGDTDGDESVEQAAKSMTKSVEETRGEGYKQEIEYLKPYVPQTMSKDEIKSELDKLGLESMANFGQKMGVAMSTLKGKADGKDVKAVLQANYLT